MADDGIPSLIGPKSNQYQLDRTNLLGDGHSGQVFAGYKVNNKNLQVAIKLDKTSGAKHEWAMLKKMQGKGVPRVHYTGTRLCLPVPSSANVRGRVGLHAKGAYPSPSPPIYIPPYPTTPSRAGVCGKWHVCVMDRLGPTLATWADSMRFSQPHSHLKEQVSSVGRKLLRLLQGLHEKGDIHGDVKPENFLVPFKPNADGTAMTKIDMTRHDPVMVDLGFSSPWRNVKYDGKYQHIEYSQALGQFHGTTRYASLHCHAGRTLARRDDLESLGYTVLYLLQGRLPWQGQEGADKEQRDQKVLRIKGSMTPSAICATAPSQMKYFMTYVRQLGFQDDPDYEFLDHCLNFGSYQLLQAWHTQLKQLSDMPEEGAPAPAQAAAAAAAAAAPGGKRKRDKSEAPAEDGQVAKKIKTTAPQEPCRAFMWFVISNNPLEGREAYTSHTTYQNLLNKVNEFWKQGLWIKHICFDGSLYTALFNSNHKYAQQTLSHQTSLEDLKKFIKEYWNKGYYVTSLARDGMGWGIVVTKFQVRRTAAARVAARGPARR